MKVTLRTTLSRADLEVEVDVEYFDAERETRVSPPEPASICVHSIRMRVGTSERWVEVRGELFDAFERWDYDEWLAQAEAHLQGLEDAAAESRYELRKDEEAVHGRGP